MIVQLSKIKFNFRNRSKTHLAITLHYFTFNLYQLLKAGYIKQIPGLMTEVVDQQKTNSMVCICLLCFILFVSFYFGIFLTFLGPSGSRSVFIPGI